MSYVLSHEVFARCGDPWDHRARLEPVPSGVRVREITGPSWRDAEISWRNDGFAPDGKPEPAPVRHSDPVAVAPLPITRVPRSGDRRSQPTEGAHYHRGEEIKGRAQPLTEAQKLARKRQRAVIKARMTRAANRIKRERQEVRNILLSL